MKQKTILALATLIVLTCLIHSTYGQARGYDYSYISMGYGLSSSILSGVNLAVNTINSVQIRNETSDKTLPGIGMLTGVGQIVLGAANLCTPARNSAIYWYENTDDNKKALSFINITVGTSTVFLSTFNLIRNREKKSDKAAWNIYSYQAPDNTMGLMLALRKQL